MNDSSTQRPPSRTTAEGTDHELDYWRARACELDVQVADLRERLLALAQVLPLQYLPLLECAVAEIETRAPATEPLLGWDDTTSFTTCDVGPELRALWRRLEVTEDPEPTR